MFGSHVLCSYDGSKSFVFVSKTRKLEKALPIATWHGMVIRKLLKWFPPSSERYGYPLELIELHMDGIVP